LRPAKRRKAPPRTTVKLQPVTPVTLTTAKADPKDNAVAPTKPQAELVLKIGNSFADVYLNGDLIHRDFMRGEIKLKPGRHELQIVKPGIGSYRPRVLQVKENGRVFEVKSSGEEQAIVGAMLFPIPKKADGAAPANWVPAGSQ